MPKLVKASEMDLIKAAQKAVKQFLVPFDQWEKLDNPEAYIDIQSGKYVKGLEMLLERAVEMNDMELSRALTLDLLRLSKLGRSKADINVIGGELSKLRQEETFSGVDTKDIRKMLGRE